MYYEIKTSTTCGKILNMIFAFDFSLAQQKTYGTYGSL